MPSQDDTRAEQSGEKPLVLVVDDDATHLKLIELLAEQLSITPRLVSSCRDALNAMDDATFDIILMDCRMPEVDGCECVKLIHGRHGKRASPPIVAVTADVLARNRDDCLEAGMDDFLGKPFTLEELREKLTTWVKRRPRED